MPHPGGSSEAILQAARDTHRPTRRSGLRQLHGRLTEDLKATRAAVAIFKSKTTECRFSVPRQVFLLVDPGCRRHRYQLDHVHWAGPLARKHDQKSTPEQAPQETGNQRILL
jgi:hypothetical protein